MSKTSTEIHLISNDLFNWFNLTLQSIEFKYVTFKNPEIPDKFIEIECIFIQVKGIYI